MASLSSCSAGVATPTEAHRLRLAAFGIDVASSLTPAARAALRDLATFATRLGVAPDDEDGISRVGMHEAMARLVDKSVCQDRALEAARREKGFAAARREGVAAMSGSAQHLQRTYDDEMADLAEFGLTAGSGGGGGGGGGGGKAGGYADKLQRKKEQLAARGADETNSHEALALRLGEVRKRAEEIALLSARAARFQGLPPDIAAARAMVEQTRQRLESMDRQFAETVGVAIDPATFYT
jgi:hypothetical protein